MGLKTRTISITELSEELEIIKWGNYNFTFKVTEIFNEKIVTYCVEDLEINCEKDIIWSCDLNDCIMNNAYSLLSFLRKRLIRIHKVYADDVLCYLLILSNGIITIESIIDH